MMVLLVLKMYSKVSTGEFAVFCKLLRVGNHLKNCVGNLACKGCCYDIFCHVLAIELDVMG